MGFIQGLGLGRLEVHVGVRMYSAWVYPGFIGLSISGFSGPGHRSLR